MDDAKQCGCDITAAPLIVKDKVVVGGTGGDAAHRGYLTAFNIETGRLAWRWYVIPGPGEKGHETWKGDSWKYGGGAPWMTGSYDPDLNLVYWGTGNASGDFNDNDRNPGANANGEINLYTASVVALDADSGKLRWYRQEVPDDLWDFDSAFEVILFDRQVRGQMRKLLAHMNKSGLTFVLDRMTGEVIRAFTVPEAQNWISGVTEDGQVDRPAGPGGWQAGGHLPQRRRREKLEFDGLLASHRLPLRTGFRNVQHHHRQPSAAAGGPLSSQRPHDHASSTQSIHLWTPGCVGPSDRKTCVERPVEVPVAGFGAFNSGRSGVHGRPGG